MNEEPTLNDKLTLLAEECPGLGLFCSPTKQSWYLMGSNASDPSSLLDSTDGTDLFCRRVVRELEARGKSVEIGNRRILVNENRLNRKSYTSGDYPNELERYAAALYQVVAG